MNTSFRLLNFFLIVLLMSSASVVLAEEAEVETTFFLPLGTEVGGGSVSPYKLPKVSESHFNSYFYNFDGTRKTSTENVEEKKIIEQPKNEKIVPQKTKKIKPTVEDFKDALEYADLKKIKKLIKKGLDKNYVNNNGEGLIYLASTVNDIEIVKYLLSVGVPLKPKGAIDPIFAVLGRRYAQSGMLQFLIDSGCDVNAKADGLIYSDKNYTPIIKMAYSTQGCCYYYRENIHYYCEHEGPFDVFEVLLKNGADINHLTEEGYGVLSAAVIDSANPEVLHYLIRKGARLDVEKYGGYSPLIAAANYNEPASLKALLEHVDIKDYYHSLMRAAFASNEIMDVLFEAGYDINAKDKNGNTALYQAIPNHFYGTQRLLEKGADVNIVLKDGSSPLIESCKRNGEYKSASFWKACQNEFKEILKRAKNVDYADNEGRTALMWVMLSEKEEKWFSHHMMMVRELIAAGADPFMKDKYGKSAYDYAKKLDKASAEMYIKAMMNN